MEQSVHRILFDWEDLFYGNFYQMFSPFLNFQYPHLIPCPQLSSMWIKDPHILETIHILKECFALYFSKASKPAPRFLLKAEPHFYLPNY